MSHNQDCRTRFVADRMLGTLCRYLRFMGYDTISANSLSQGNSSEDTLLLRIAHDERRVLLTRDSELATRAGPSGVLINSDDVIRQVTQLRDGAFIEPKVRMNRCSLCNTELREASPDEIAEADYAPKDNRGFSFFYCPNCKKLYWDGSHGKHLADRITRQLGVRD
jgi:uncharacterized protein with PIN domain